MKRVRDLSSRERLDYVLRCLVPVRPRILEARLALREEIAARDTDLMKHLDAARNDVTALKALANKLLDSLPDSESPSLDGFAR